MKKMFMIMILPFLIFSQERITVTLESGIELALQKNPDFQMSQKNVDKAKSDIWIAYSNIMPQLDASANFQRAWEIQEQTIPNFIKVMLGTLATPDMPDFVSISFGLENTVTYGLRLNQPLFLGFAGIAGINAAYAAKDASEQNLESKKQALILQTTQSFYSCLLAQELVEVQEEALKQANTNLDIVQKKYDVGSASGFDKMRAEVEVANLKPEVLNANNNYQYTLTILRTVLGLRPGTQLEIKGSLYFADDSYDSLNYKQWLEMAWENRADLKALKYNQTISKEAITIARSTFLPKLYFSTDYSFLGARNDLKFTDRDFNKGFTSAISLQIPLFHGTRRVHEYKKAKIDYRMLQDSEKMLRDMVSAEVEVALNAFNEAKENYNSAGETVRLASEALRLANLLYEEGSNTQLDVLNSQLALTQAKMNYARSLYSYQISRYSLRKASGILQGVLE